MHFIITPHCLHITDTKAASHRSTALKVDLKWFLNVNQERGRLSRNKQGTQIQEWGQIKRLYSPVGPFLFCASPSSLYPLCHCCPLVHCHLCGHQMPGLRLVCRCASRLPSTGTVESGRCSNTGKRDFYTESILPLAQMQWSIKMGVESCPLWIPEIVMST